MKLVGEELCAHVLVGSYDRLARRAYIELNARVLEILGHPLKYIDIPVVQGCALIFAVTYILLNLIADIIGIITNPRLLHPK